MLLILFIISTNSSFPFACIIFTNNTTKVIKRNSCGITNSSEICDCDTSNFHDFDSNK